MKAQDYQIIRFTNEQIENGLGTVLSTIQAASPSKTPRPRRERGRGEGEGRYTGQQAEGIGLYDYGARWYYVQLGRFLQADTIVPNTGDPQAWDRYAYVDNNPVNFTDPTGHKVCEDDSLSNCYTDPQIKHQAGLLSTPSKSNDDKQQRAYSVFTALEALLGRSLTYEEILALVAANEFIANSPQAGPATEAMGRQFYYFCGSSGICGGEELWKFLGAQEGWYSNDPNNLLAQLKSDGANYYAAVQVLGQPALNSGNKETNWRGGSYQGVVPFTYGNLSMFPNTDWLRDQLKNAPKGSNSSSLYFGDWLYDYIVMTLNQYYYWKHLALENIK